MTGSVLTSDSWLARRKPSRNVITRLMMPRPGQGSVMTGSVLTTDSWLACRRPSLNVIAQLMMPDAGKDAP